MALPTTGITTTLVGTTLGVATRNVGNLCRAESVNMWSRYKPVRKAKVTSMTQDATNDYANDDFASVNYGISIPSFPDLNALLSAYHTHPGGAADWIYNVPRGANYNEYFRIGDFRKYDKTARPAIAGGSISRRAYKTGPLEGRYITGTIMRSTGGATALGYLDLISSKPYLGIAIFDTSDTLVKYVINSTPMSDSVQTRVDYVSASEPAIPDGTYRAMLFLTSSPIKITGISGIHGQSSRYNIIEVITSNFYISLLNTWVGASQYKTVRVKAVFSNSTGTTVSLLNSRLRLRYPNKAFEDTLIQGEQQITIGTLNIPDTGTGEYELTYEFTNVDSEQYWIIWWDNTGAYPNRLAADILIPMT